MPDKKYYNILGEVSDTGLTTLTEQKLNLLARDFYNKFGYNLDVTSMKRNGDGSSWHDSGQAIDVANDLLASDPEARAWLIKQGEKYGLTSLDEYTNPSANATGGHIHFSDHGEPIPGVSTQVDSAPNIDNSTANDFYNNDSYVLNNDYSNLEWVTASYNMKHAYSTGLAKPSRGMLGKKNPNGGRKGHPVRVLETGEEFPSITACAKAINGNDRHICDCLSGRQSFHKGYSFELI